MIICNDCSMDLEMQSDTIYTAPGIDDDRFFCRSCFDARFEYSIDDRGRYVVTADRFEVKV